MNCIKPNRAWVKNGAKTKNGKRVIEWTKPKNDPENYSEIYLPCNQCIGCRVNYREEWTQRIMLEKKYNEFSYFITLTYDNENIQTRLSLDEKIESTTLVKEDLQNFWKRLRNHQKVRYYRCGEYGETTNRSHYHRILYTDKEITDLEPFYISKDHNQIYRSEYLKKIWGKGHVAIGEVTWDSARYVAGYVIDKLKGEKAEIYDYLNIEPPFNTMSLKPAIGRQYYEDNKDKIYTNDEIIYLNKGKSISAKPARYFDELYDLENPLKLETIKKKRMQERIRNRKLTYSRTTLSEEEYLQNQAENFEKKIKQLNRNHVFDQLG